MSEVCGVKFELCCLVEILFQLFGWFGGRFWDGISGFGLFGSRFWSSGRSFWSPKLSLFELLKSFWIIVGTGRSKNGGYSIGGKLLGAFWEDFEVDLKLFWIPKVIKRTPKSIPETYQILRPKF